MTCSKSCGVVKADVVGSSKEWKRIYNITEPIIPKSFPLTLGQALIVYQRIRCETARTKVPTEARCEYILFCLFPPSYTFIACRRGTQEVENIMQTLHYFVLLHVAKMSLLKTSVWKWGKWLFLCHSFTWVFIHCNYLTTTTHCFLVLHKVLLN